MHEDLSNAIFAINNKSKTEKNVFYTIKKNSSNSDSAGNSTLDNDSEYVYAKKLHLQNRWKFFVRIDENNMLYNPYNIYGNVNSKKNLVNKSNEPQVKFKETSHNLFEMYLTFLQTQNMSIYNNINREMV
jgi:hypothetical protein